jgi:PIN domain nuclease of toxin-antitoxin system
MKYTVIKNYLDSDFCGKLTQDAEKFVSNKNYTLIHGNRSQLSSSSLSYYELVKNSSNWKKLNEKINSQEFLDYCCNNLSIKSEKFSLQNFFKLKGVSSKIEILKKLSETQTKLMPTKSLFKYSLYRLYREVLRKFKFSKLFYPKKIPIELLFDFSKAGNGYSRAIHRDSDSRVIVFLIYLNSMEGGGNTTDTTGGTLDLYKLIKEDKDLVRPNRESCKMIDSVKPEAGKLIIFLNDNESFHAVDEIKNLKGHRNFLYGGFTSLAQKSPFISNKSKSKTEFHVYE